MRHELPVAAASAEPEVDLAGADLELLLGQEEAAQITAAGAASNPVPHLEIDYKKFLKSSLVPVFTSVPGNKCVIMRTLLSAGLTLKKLTGHNCREYREQIGDDNKDDGLKADDICAILVQCGDALVLAVVLINKFCLGPQKVPLTWITGLSTVPFKWPWQLPGGPFHWPRQLPGWQGAIVQTNGHLKENNCPFTRPMSMQMALKWLHGPVHSHGFVQVNGINISKNMAKMYI
jgi:hypothetical protein